MKPELIALLDRLTANRRELIHLMTLERRGGVNALPFDSEAIASLSSVINLLSDRIQDL